MASLPFPTNDLVSGGLVLMLAGTGLSLVYRALPVAWTWALRRVSVSIEVRDAEVFLWLGDWIESMHYGETCRRLSVDVEHVGGGRGEPTERRLVFAPGRGRHVFRYRGRWFWLDRNKEEVADEGGVVQREYYQLRSLDRDPAVLKAILQQAVQRAERRRLGRVPVYAWAGYSGWKEMRLQPTRDLETVVLDEGVRERIATDLGAFRRARDRYRELGVPWRRGYLFHGPPGCGKTSFARALAGHFDMPIYLVSLTGQGISDQRLIEALNDARPESILLIEDVDAAFDARARRRPGSDGLTFSGLLNAVDGIAAQEGRVIIMTTNHRDRLEPALIRPGRVDVEQYFGLATPDQVRELFLRFFPGQDRLAEWVAGAIPPQTASPAQLQGMFLEARDEPMAAVREVVGRWGVRNLRALPAPGRVG